MLPAALAIGPASPAPPAPLTAAGSMLPAALVRGALAGTELPPSAAAAVGAIAGMAETRDDRPRSMSPSLFSHALIFVLSIVACSAGSETVTTSDDHIETVRSIEQKLGIKLPKEPSFLAPRQKPGSMMRFAQSCAFPPRAGPNSCATARVKRFRQGGANLLRPDHGFWDPLRAKMLRSGEVTLQSGRALLVAIDESSSDALIVFAMNYSKWPMPPSAAAMLVAVHPTAATEALHSSCDS